MEEPKGPKPSSASGVKRDEVKDPGEEEIFSDPVDIPFPVTETKRKPRKTEVAEEKDLPAAVTRQLPWSEIISRPEALQAEFEGISKMNSWGLDSAQEESDVRSSATSQTYTSLFC